MILTREARKEDSPEPVPQYLHSGSDPQDTFKRMTKEPASAQEIKASSDTLTPPAEEVLHHLGRSH